MIIDRNILIILFTSDFYKCYYALNLASTYQACNINVTLFFSGYSCNFLRNDWIKFDKKNFSKKFSKKKMTSYLDVFNLCLEIKVKFFYCDTAMNFLNLERKDLINNNKVVAMSLYEIINKHKNNKTIFI